MRISLGNARFFDADADQFLLDAALDASLSLPYSCRGGNCGACRARLLSGEIHYPHGAPLGLSAAEVNDGFILLCQARACSDSAIEILEQRAAGELAVKRLPCRVERAVPLSHDVMGLQLRLPAVEDFEFRAGQYLDILLPGGRRRSFSIASPPGTPTAHRLLELHVRRVVGGEFSEPLFHTGARHSLLTIEGPLGRFMLQPLTAAPLLFVGGGTGIAPLLSILRHIIGQRIEHEMALYWGVRSEQDLYAREAIATLLAHAAKLRYVPVLSEPTETWPGARGWVHAAVLADYADLHEQEIYAAGPPAMIEALGRDFVDRGADPSRIYADSFDYATDPPLRQRNNSVSKS